jgi:hypothetical protein
LETGASSNADVEDNNEIDVDHDRRKHWAKLQQHNVEVQQSSQGRQNLGQDFDQLQSQMAQLNLAENGGGPLKIVKEESLETIEGIPGKNLDVNGVDGTGNDSNQQQSDNSAAYQTAESELPKKATAPEKNSGDAQRLKNEWTARTLSR